MLKKSLITTISISNDTENDLNKLQTRLHKNRSQLIRDLVEFYLSSSKKSVNKSDTNYQSNNYSDPNIILRRYYELISYQRSKKPLIVIGIGIINKKKLVLIGQRKFKDSLVPNLTWTFPSGKFFSLNFESEVIKTIQAETGYLTRLVSVIHARLIPDTFDRRVRIIAIYHHCKVISGRPKAGGDFKEVKWIPATDVTKYFTTSVCDEIMNFLGRL